MSIWKEGREEKRREKEEKARVTIEKAVRKRKKTKGRKKKTGKKKRNNEKDRITSGVWKIYSFARTREKVENGGSKVVKVSVKLPDLEAAGTPDIQCIVLP